MKLRIVIKYKQQDKNSSFLLSSKMRHPILLMNLCHAKSVSHSLKKV